MQERLEELLRQCERLLRDADADLAYAIRRQGSTIVASARKRRNAVNAACNALHRATKA